jgi:hypothetical protein
MLLRYVQAIGVAYVDQFAGLRLRTTEAKEKRIRLTTAKLLLGEPV